MLKKLKIIGISSLLLTGCYTVEPKYRYGEEVVAVNGFFTGYSGRVAAQVPTTKCGTFPFVEVSEYMVMRKAFDWEWICEDDLLPAELK